MRILTPEVGESTDYEHIIDDQVALRMRSGRMDLTLNLDTSTARLKRDHVRELRDALTAILGEA